MKRKVKVALLFILFHVKEFVFRRRNLFLQLEKKEIEAIFNCPKDYNQLNGATRLIRVINGIHTTSYRRRKLDHYKSIRIKNGKTRNRQSKNS